MISSPKRCRRSDFPQGELGLATACRPGHVGKAGISPCLARFRTPEGRTVEAVAGGFSTQQIAPASARPRRLRFVLGRPETQAGRSADRAGSDACRAAQSEHPVFDVQRPCLRRAPVSGYLGLPKDAKPRACRPSSGCTGAGVRSSALANAVKSAEAGMLSMDINAHGIPNGKPNEFYAELSAGRAERLSPCRPRAARRSISAACSPAPARDRPAHARAEWDGKVLAVIGHSQERRRHWSPAGSTPA